MQVTDEMIEVACAHHWPGPWPGDRSEQILAMRRDDMRAALTAALSEKQAAEVKAEYSHEDRVTLASCLSWDINEITPSDVKGILERLEIEGYRLVRSALVDVPVEPVEKSNDEMLRLAVAAVLEADTEFRAQMPKGWEGDPLTDELDGLRRIFEAHPPLSHRGEDSAEVYRQALERIAKASARGWNVETATEALNTARAIAETAIAATRSGSASATEKNGAANVSRITIHEAKFCMEVMARPGAKLNNGEAQYYEDDGSEFGKHFCLWKTPEALGLITCVGGYKWEPTEKLIDIVTSAICEKGVAE